MITQLMQYPVFDGELPDIQLANSLQVIHTINAYSYVIAEKNPAFKSALQRADILIADGFPIVVASKFLNRKTISKIAGADLFFHLMNEANQQSGKVFFLGSTSETLNKICIRASNEFSNISTAYYSPPYKNVFSEEDSEIMISKINDFEPDILFVGMTAPKQEVWVDSYKDELNAKAVCSIGAVFDFYAGTINRAPKLMINLKLEWLYRLIREPKRMWKRYLLYSPLFLFYFILYLVKARR